MVHPAGPPFTSETPAEQLKELEAALDRAAEQPQRFNLSPDEIASRRKWIQSARRQLEGLLDTLKTATAAPVSALEAKVRRRAGARRAGRGRTARGALRAGRGRTPARVLCQCRRQRQREQRPRRRAFGKAADASGAPCHPAPLAPGAQG
jgi:hypothetical protein